MRYPVDKVFITQDWGVNKDIYSRFGYQGHNGIDLRIFDDNGNRASSGKVFSPHSGTVLEAYFDEDGYGRYLKIENDEEGSILGHNKQLLVKVGDVVKEGQLVAYSDNTGWSTGTHVHWGYYRKPRNKSNGYGGTIDPTPYLEGGSMSDDMMELPKKTFEELVTKSSRYDEFIKMGFHNPDEVSEKIDELSRRINEREEKLQEAASYAEKLEKQAGENKKKLESALSENRTLQQKNEQLKKDVQSLQEELKEMAKDDGTSLTVEQQEKLRLFEEQQIIIADLREQLENNKLANSSTYWSDLLKNIIERLSSRKLWIAVITSATLFEVASEGGLTLTEAIQASSPLLAFLGIEGASDIVERSK